MRRTSSVFAFVVTISACGGSAGPGDPGPSSFSSLTGVSPVLGNGGPSSNPAAGAGGPSSAPAVGGGGPSSVPAVGAGGPSSAPSLGGAGGGSTGTIGPGGCAGLVAANDPCGQCTASQCCPQIEACHGDAMCWGLVNCEITCSGTACNQCAAQFPNGQALLDIVSQCGASACQAACTTVVVNNLPPSGSSCLNPGNPCVVPAECCSNICSGATSTSTGSCG